ncbi:ribonuclease H-like domain-containing protein [Gaertneriomyces semiglobifer]|nr:ribonuclease H-like domain-containing protein [Gaertneriomyces semiglobifer]
MEVLRNNFEALLPSIEEAVAESDFVAIDTELTGIGTDKVYEMDMLDTMQQRYDKIAFSAKNFLTIQFGICTFKWDDTAKSYIVKPFNCFIFPRSGTRQLGLDRQFLAQAGSLEFLLGNQFDFNKWISQGVPYVNHDEEAAARIRIGRLNGDIPIEEKNREFVDTAIKDIAHWLQNSPDPSITIKCPSSFHRRLIHQEVRKQWLSALKTEGKFGQITVRKMTVEERKNDKSREAELSEELEQLIGFRKVIDILAHAKKPIVGHNMMLDLLQTYHQFHSWLPQELSTFKKNVHRLFPQIFDTKYLCHSIPSIQAHILNSGLSEVLNRVSMSPFTHPLIKIHPDFGGYVDEDRYHEAGYDAYATGVVFLRLAAQAVQLPEDSRLDFDHSILQTALNKLHLMRSDMSHLNIAGDDELPDRKHIFHIFDFPKEVSTKDLQSQFGSLGSVSIKWLSDTSVYLIVKDDEKVKDVMELFNREPQSASKDINGGDALSRKFDFKIEPFEQYERRLSGIRSVVDVGQDDIADNGAEGDVSLIVPSGATTTSTSSTEDRDEARLQKRKKSQGPSIGLEESPPRKRKRDSLHSGHRETATQTALTRHVLRGSRSFSVASSSQSYRTSEHVPLTPEAQAISDDGLSAAAAMPTPLTARELKKHRKEAKRKTRHERQHGKEHGAGHSEQSSRPKRKRANSYDDSTVEGDNTRANRREHHSTRDILGDGRPSKKRGSKDTGSCTIM